MKCIINGKLILKDSIAENMAIVFDDKIEKIAPLCDIDTSAYEVIDAKGMFVSPGLVDMHIHGYLGADASDADAEGIKKMAEGIIKNGVTAWCPTTMTVSKAEIEAAFDAVREVKNSDSYYGSRILGVNSESPFINAKKKGAQAEEHILKPDADFIEKVKSVSGGGVNTAVEVTGVAVALDQTLDCMKKFGRVALLGCTRKSDFSIDFYHKVHGPGITLIGAHTSVRPNKESYPAYFTHEDDIKTLLNLTLGGRINVKNIIKATYKPKDCQEVYTRLVNDKNFPICAQFNWEDE